MSDFNPDDFLGETAAAPTGADFNPDSFLGDVTDPSTGDMRKKYADGLSPETPINKSPIGPIDRLRFSLGNTAGAIKDLKANYEDAMVDNKGKLLVKDKGLWHRVDPKNMGDGDAYDVTNELLADGAEALVKMVRGGVSGAAMGGAAGAAGGTVALPVVGTVTGGLGGAAVGGVAGAGAALLTDIFEDEIVQGIQKGIETVGGKKSAAAAITLGAQGIKAAGGIKNIAKMNAPALLADAAFELGRTSLGRLVGTYEATPEQQFSDIAFEGLLNLGTATIATGVKPTASVIGDSMKKLGSTMKDVGSAQKNLIANTFGISSKAGYDLTMNLLDDGDYVGSEFKRLGVGAANSGKIIERATSESIDITKGLARKVPEARKILWDKMTKDIMNDADDSFSAGVSDIVKHGQQKVVGMGLGEVVDGKFAMKPYEQIVKEAKLTGNIPEEFLQKESYDYLKNFFDDLKPFEDMTNLTGKDGARQLMNFKRYLSNSVYRLTETAKEDALPATAIMIKGLEETLDSRAVQKFAKTVDGVTRNTFLERNEFWKKTSGELSNVLKVIEKARKTQSDEPYEQLFKHITARSGSNQTKKEGFEAAVEVLKQAGMDVEPQLRKLKAVQTVRAFAPYVTPGTGTNVLFASGGALVSGNIPLAVGTGAVGAALSPRVNYGVLRGGAKAAKATSAMVNAGFQGLKFLRGLPPEQIKLMVKDPKALATFLQIMNQSVTTEVGLKDKLVGSALEQSMPTPTPLLPPEEK